MRAFALLLALLLSGTAGAQSVGSYLRDLPLVDQHGNEVDLYSLMKGKTVVINSFFATCSGSCPVMANAFAAIRDRFQDRVGRELVLVSITVDPERDTPEKLRAYAKQMKAGEGWYFLSGSKEQVERALRKLGQYVESREQHQNVFLIGNDRTGLWKKAFGLAKPAELIELVRVVLDDPGVPAAGGR